MEPPRKPWQRITLKRIANRNILKKRTLSTRDSSDGTFFTKYTSKFIDAQRTSPLNTEFHTLLNTIDMSWYEKWLSQQLENLPYCITELSINNEKVLKRPAVDSILKLMEIINGYSLEHEGICIDEIVQYLQSTGTFDLGQGSLEPQRLLVFSILGWGSMMYQAAFNVCSMQELAIHHDYDQPQSGLVFDTYQVSADLSDRPLSILLKAFGNVLPARCSGAQQWASESSKTVSSWLPIYPIETNAYLLHSLLRVEIRWVDTLALHLDYDKSSKTLSLFSYPSFCLEMLRSDGIIYSFASIEDSGMDPRANKNDISQFLQEVLLSYRLLFGQSASSRKFFRRNFRPSSPYHQLDTMLPLICTKKELSHPSITFPADKEIYFAARDFPVLYERIELIVTELQNAKPKSIGDLIRDKRDTLQYWTFWLVSIFGGISIILSLIQVILQAIQLFKT